MNNKDVLWKYFDFSEVGEKVKTCQKNFQHESLYNYVHKHHKFVWNWIAMIKL